MKGGPSYIKEEKKPLPSSLIIFLVAGNTVICDLIIVPAEQIFFTLGCSPCTYHPLLSTDDVHNPQDPIYTHHMTSVTHFLQNSYNSSNSNNI
jgi:hypothetical protein